MHYPLLPSDVEISEGALFLGCGQDEEGRGSFGEI